MKKLAAICLVVLSLCFFAELALVSMPLPTPPPPPFFTTANTIQIVTTGSFDPGMTSTYGAPLSSVTTDFRIDQLIIGVTSGVTTSSMCPGGMCATAQANFSISTTNIPEAISGGSLSLSTPTLDVNALVGTRITRFRLVQYCLQAWEYWPTYRYFGQNCAAITSPTDNFSGVQSYFNFGHPGNSIGPVEWFSNSVPMGAGTGYCTTPAPVAACSPDLTDSQHGSLGSWTWAGNAMTDGSGKGGNLNSSGSPTFTAYVGHNPSCFAGPQQTFLAGGTGTLSGAVALDLSGITSAPTVAWTKIAGPGVTITGPSTLAPTLSAIQNTMVLGGLSPSVASYVFQLSVTDGASNNTTCTIKDGAVTVDADGVVVPLSIAAGPFPANKIGQIITDTVGEQIPIGAGPWPKYDALHTFAASDMIAHEYQLVPNGIHSNTAPCTSWDQTVCPHTPYWTNFGPGTVSIAPGSSTLVGVGTNFLTAFDISGGVPASGGAMVTFQYSGTGGTPNATVGWGPPQIHYGVFGVNSCSSDTSCLLNTAPTGESSPGNNVGWMGWKGTLTGQWAADKDGAPNYFQWRLQNNAIGGFYDSLGTTLLTAYIRSGVDDYYWAFLTGARRIIDLPMNDGWAAVAGYKFYGGPAPQGQNYGFMTAGQWSEETVFLYGVNRGDYPCTDAACTSGTGTFPQARNMYDFSGFSVFNAFQPTIGDRNDGHFLSIFGRWARWDPKYLDSTHSMNGQQYLDARFSPSAVAVYTDPTTGAWLDGNINYGSFDHTFANSTINAASSFSGNPFVGITFTGCTNASPIVCSTTSTQSVPSGSTLSINGVVGNTAANGFWTVTIVTDTSATLIGSTGNGTYVSGGVGTYSWCGNDNCYLIKAHMTNNSPTVTFNNCSGGGCAGAGTITLPTATFGSGAWLWVLNPSYTAAMPASYSLTGLTISTASYLLGSPLNWTAGDLGNYVIASTTAPNSMTLTTPFLGTTGDYLFQLHYGAFPNANANGITGGPYVQDYMQGISVDGGGVASRHLSLTGDNATAAVIGGLMAKGANFILNSGIDSSRKGPWYFGDTLNCAPYNLPGGLPPHDGFCDINAPDAYGARVFIPETSMGIMAYLRYLGGNAVARQDMIAWMDTYFNAAWADGSAGCIANAPLCSYDGFSVVAIDAGQFGRDWSGSAPWKWYGQFFGSSHYSSWLALRLRLKHVYSGGGISGTNHDLALLTYPPAMLKEHRTRVILDQIHSPTLAAKVQ